MSSATLKMMEEVREIGTHSERECPGSQGRETSRNGISCLSCSREISRMDWEKARGDWTVRKEAVTRALFLV